MNSSTVNRVTLVGYCGETPEMIYIKSTGNPVCNFRVATHKNYKNKEGVNFEETIWHKVLITKSPATNAVEPFLTIDFAPSELMLIVAAPVLVAATTNLND